MQKAGRTIKSDTVTVRGFRSVEALAQNNHQLSTVLGVAGTCQELRVLGMNNVEHLVIGFENTQTEELLSSYEAAHLFLGGTVVLDRMYEESGAMM